MRYVLVLLVASIAFGVSPTSAGIVKKAGPASRMQRKSVFRAALAKPRLVNALVRPLSMARASARAITRLSSVLKIANESKQRKDVLRRSGMFVE